MKRTFTFLAALISFSLLSFKGKVADDTFVVDAGKSTVTWLGKKIGDDHAGTIKLSSGSLILAGSALKGGNFAVDMNTIASPDGDRLVTHLKSEDFFFVAKNPTSTFVITKVTPAGADAVTITGNLMIKGTTLPISFPATVKRSGNTVTATAKSIKVDRAKYDIRYGSKSFFASIGDKAIEDDFELGVTLVAAKK